LRLHLNCVGMVRGGGLTHLLGFVPALANLRPQWDVVVYLGPGGPALSVPGVRTERVNRTAWRRLIWDSYTVGRRARTADADVLLCMANYGPIRSPVPSILYQANSKYFDRAWVSRMGRVAQGRAIIRRNLAFVQMKHSAAVVVPSQAMAGYLCSWRACPSDVPIERIPHGMDLERFRFSASNHLGRIRLVSLSQGSRHKDPGLLIALMANLVDRGLDVELEATISDADDPRYVAALRGQVSLMRLEERVRFVGRVDSARFLAGADAIVLPSITESFGYPVIEAMASGVPVVASEILSSVELLGDLGWYFPSGNPAVAADRIMEVINTSPADLSHRLSAARHLAEKYTWERNARQLVQLIETVTQAQQSNTPGMR
jgi:glycosyltransferase involved in cell wall biosynthesis